METSTPSSKDKQQCATESAAATSKLNEVAPSLTRLQRKAERKQKRAEVLADYARHGEGLRYRASDALTDFSIRHSGAMRLGAGEGAIGAWVGGLMTYATHNPIFLGIAGVMGAAGVTMGAIQDKLKWKRATGYNRYTSSRETRRIVQDIAEKLGARTKQP